MSKDEKPIIANAFSPDYVSQLVPFKPAKYKRPALANSTPYIFDNIADPDFDPTVKRAKLLKSNI